MLRALKERKAQATRGVEKWEKIRESEIGREVERVVISGRKLEESMERDI